MATSAVGRGVKWELSRRIQADVQFHYAWYQWPRSKGVDTQDLTREQFEDFAQDFCNEFDSGNIPKVEIAKGLDLFRITDFIRRGTPADRWQWQTYHRDKAGFNPPKKPSLELAQGFLKAHAEGSLDPAPAMATAAMVKGIKSLSAGRMRLWYKFCAEHGIDRNPVICPESLIKQFWVDHPEPYSDPFGLRRGS